MTRQELKRFPNGSDKKESDYRAGDPGLIPGSGRSAGEGNGNHSSILAWKIPWTEEAGRLQSIGSQRVGHDWATSQSGLVVGTAPIVILHSLQCDPEGLFGKQFLAAISGLNIWRDDPHQPCPLPQKGLARLQCLLTSELSLFFFWNIHNDFIFNWRIIALHYCIGFCHTSTWISHRYTYVPSLLNLPPTSHPFPPL